MARERCSSLTAGGSATPGNHGWHLLSSTRGRRRLRILTAVALACLEFTFATALAASPPEQTTARSIRISVRDRLFSIEAENQPWNEVLAELERKGGILFHLSNPVPGAANASFIDLPLKDALQHLFGSSVGFLILDHAKNGELSGLRAEVWLLSGEASRRQRPRQASRQDETDNRQQEDEPGGNGGDARGDEAEALFEYFQEQPGEARESALHALDKERRLEAIFFLGQRGSKEDLQVLAELLQDPEAIVRESALQELGEAVGTDSWVREQVINAMETAEDREIRQLAAEILGSFDHHQAKASTMETGDPPGQQLHRQPPQPRLR